MSAQDLIGFGICFPSSLRLPYITEFNPKNCFVNYRKYKDTGKI